MVKEAASRPARPAPLQRYTRGQDTRARILAAAIELFGRAGFEGATTRDIAAAASVNLPALKYYFGGKEGLYRACVEQIASELESALAAPRTHIEQALARGPQSADSLAALAGDLVEAIVDFWIGSDPAKGRVMLILREQTSPSAAFDPLFERVMSPIVSLCARIVARVLRREESDADIRIRALSIVGQSIFFRVAEAASLRVLGWSDFHGERLVALKAELRRGVEAALTGAGARAC